MFSGEFSFFSFCRLPLVGRAFIKMFIRRRRNLAWLLFYERGRCFLCASVSNCYSLTRTVCSPVVGEKNSPPKKCTSSERTPVNFSWLPVNYFFTLFFSIVSVWTFRRCERNASQGKHEFSLSLVRRFAACADYSL